MRNKDLILIWKVASFKILNTKLILFLTIFIKINVYLKIKS